METDNFKFSAILLLFVYTLVFLFSTPVCPRVLAVEANCQSDPLFNFLNQVLVESEPIYFDYNSTRLSAAAQKILARNAAWLTDNPVAAVMISGHTDEVGTLKNNYQLGMERAQAVRNFLQTLGVDEHRMMCRSFGEVQPLDTKTALDTWRRNRRVQFELVPPHGFL